GVSVVNFHWPKSKSETLVQRCKRIFTERPRHAGELDRAFVTIGGDRRNPEEPVVDGEVVQSQRIGATSGAAVGPQRRGRVAPPHAVGGGARHPRPTYSRVVRHGAFDLHHRGRRGRHGEGRHGHGV